MNKGKSAVAGMDLEKSMTNSNKSYNLLKYPKSKPNGIPMKILIPIPNTTLLKVKKILEYTSFDVISKKNCFIIIKGLGNISLLKIPK